MNSNLPQHQTCVLTYPILGTKVTSPYPVKLTPGETRLVFSLQRLFAPENILPDFYAPKVNYQTKFLSAQDNFALCAGKKSVAGSELVQIDCLAFNEAGVFVFESKDYSGWIYGDVHASHWTQTLNYGQEKHHFPNPLKQNVLHVAAIADFLPQNIPIYSVVVFGRDSTLKTTFPKLNQSFITTQSSLIPLLQQIKTAAPCSSPLSELRSAFQHHRIIPDSYIREEHIHNIQGL